jgi:hypothetical protein
MHISSLKNSNFLKKEDCDPPVLVTISSVTQENVAKEGAPQELKWCLHLEEFDKPMVLNSTNGQLIARITGSEETDDWNGHRVVLYHDPSVSFGGKIIGGIRVRAPKKQVSPAPTKPLVEEHETNIPF